MAVDDLLPVDQNGKLIFASSSNKDTNEYWVAMCEKAFAKLHGCYESLSGGCVLEALTSLTGVPQQLFSIPPAPSAYFSELTNLLANNPKNKALFASKAKGCQSLSPIQRTLSIQKQNGKYSLVEFKD